MKKITLLLFMLISFSGYSQLALEGFETTTGPDVLPSTNWTLGTGNWAVFDNGVGISQRWGIVNTVATPPNVFQGVNAAVVRRENNGPANSTSEDYLSTPAVTIPANGQLRFYTRMFTSGNQGTIYQIKVAPATSIQTNPASYILVQQWTELDLILPVTNFNTYTEKLVDLTAFAGQSIYVSFVKVFTQPTTAIDGDSWFVDNVQIESACITPTGLTIAAITSTSATLNWTNPNGPVNGWDIEVITAAGTPTGVPTHTSVTAPFTVTGLLPNTSYKYYVRARCSTGFPSPWSIVSATFTTNVLPPVCGGNFVDSGGTGANYSNNENQTTTICPVNAGDLVTVTFTSFNTQNGFDFLQVFDGNTITAPLLANLSGTTVPPPFTGNSANGCLTLLFTSDATTVAAGWASNISCAPAPLCRRPSALAFNTVTTTSVILNWTQPANPSTPAATAWQVLALPCGSAVPTTTTTGFVAATSNPFTLTGLTSATCYDIYVRAVCSPTEVSQWSIPVAVTTLLAPPVCGGNFVDTGGLTANYPNNANQTTTICPVNIGDAVTVTFTAFNTQLNTDLLRIYDGNDATATLLATLSGTAIPPSFTSSATSGCLTLVFTSNATTNAAGWAANVTCAPPPTCRAPVALTNSTTTHNSVLLNWIQPANPNASVASSWHVLALPCGSPAPTSGSTGFVTATTNPFTLTGLLPNTCYNIYVRAVCNAPELSTWAGPTTTTTLLAPPVCGGNFVDAGGPAGTYAANSNITTIICPVNAGDVVTVTFTAFNTEATWDGLYAYNGNAVVPANIIASANPAGNVPGGIAGSYWGTAIPGPFTSIAANGCLTFVFRSDATGQLAGWVSNVTCAPPPTCARPTAIVASTVLPTSVVLNWTQPANPNGTTASAWEVLALPCAAPPPTAGSTGFVAATTNPFTLTGLASGTCYNIYIRAVCSPTDSSSWGTLSNITTAAAPPVCGGNFVDAGGPGAAYAANSNVTTVICPTNPGDVVTVTFTSFNTETNWDGLYVYNGNAVVPANIIASANPPGNVPGGLAGSYWGTAIPGPFTSTSADGCLTFVFRSDGSINNPGWVSNVTCGPPPSCRIPTGITTSVVLSTSVVVAWTQPTNPNGSVASAWQILALPCTAPPPTAGSTGFVSAPTNPFTLTGLSASTCYNIYVRAVCSPTDSSTWGGPRSITTQATPPLCGQTFTDVAGAAANYANNSNVTTTICPTNPGEVVTVTFTAFNIQATADGLYVYQGQEALPANIIASTNPPGTVPGGLAGAYWGTAIPNPFISTTANGCLTFVFRSGATVNAAGWVANVTCAPAPPCSRPELVSATNITQTSATLSWTQPLNPNGSVATAWEVLVLPAGSPPPTSSGIPATSPYNATGLLAGTPYVFYVRAICSATATSIWTSFPFVTRPSNDDCASAIFAVVNQNLNCVQTTPGTLAGATGSLPVTTCPGVANDDVWFTFTATAVTHIISFNNVSAPAPVLNYAIFSGTNCGTLTQLGCNSGANLIPGTTYFIRVYSATDFPQLTTFNLCIGTLPCAEAPAFCTGQTVSYANTTNIPSLGTIGCLGSSPNSAFFFLQVNQAGPLSYLISQVSTAGNPIDVDYVAWGPFTSLSSACAGVPSNPLTGATPIPTSATGCPGTLHACSFSAAPTEIMCIPNAQLCQVYVIMITNFSNQPGTVTFSQTNTGGGTTACFPINTFNYPQTNYCIGGANPVPVLGPGASHGTYTSTPGLVIDSATGVINLAASTPGNYIVTSTTLTSTGGACTSIPTITTTRTVIITAPASATINYGSGTAIPTFCNAVTEFQNPTRTGTAGGTYSAAPAGLLINTLTGGVLPVSSTPGTYTITYTVAAFGGCVAYTTTAQLEILAMPLVVQPAPVSVCNTYTLPALTVGNYYAQSGGAGTPLNITTPVTSTQTIYIYAISNGCSTERSFSVTINVAPTPTLNVIQTTCAVQTGTISIDPPLGTGFEYSIDNGPFQAAVTFNSVAPGNHTITVRDVSSGCLSVPLNVTINPVPVTPTVLGFSYSTPVCNNATVNPLPTTVTGFTANGLFSSTAGLTINSTTGLINLATSTAGTYVVTYTVAPIPAICLAGGTSTATIVINPVITPVTTFSYPSTPACFGDGNLAAITTTTGFTTGGVYTSTAGLTINGSTGGINLNTSTPGTYTVTYTVGADTSICRVTGSSTATITIIAPIQIAIEGGCQSINYKLTALPINNSFNPSTVTSYIWQNAANVEVGTGQTITVTEVGTYTVTITFNGCDTTSAPVSVDSIVCTIQKGISANGDGLNDTFDLRGFGVKELGIFNRYGQKVYTFRNYTNQWVGQTDNGDELPDGTYYYVINRENGEVKTGWIYINRVQ